jgi:O-antigen chain-terminating methyltransferase
VAEERKGPTARPEPPRLLIEDGDLVHVNRAWDIFVPPAESPIKAALRRVFAPMFRLALRQQRTFNAAVTAHLNRPLSDSWLKRWESLSAREARLEAMAASYAELKDMVAIAQQTAMALKREMERLGATGTTGTTGTAGTLESVKYVGFEDRFRGSQSAIRARLESYVPMLAQASPVIEIGCGRGEFLDLLRAHGIAARGVDVNPAMVQVSRERGLDAVDGDALSFLQAQPDGSLGGIFAAQVVEHLEPDYLMRLIDTAVHKLRRGGVLVLETVNPACWNAFFESYLRDLTHVRALHPDTLQYLVRASGFQDVTVEYRSPVADDDRLQPVTRPPGDLPPGVSALVDAFNANVERLNGRLFTFMDYAVVGRK